MRRSGGRRLAQYEDERVVYYDLDADSHRRNLLLSPDAVSAPAQPRGAATASAKAAGEGSDNQIFPRQQQPLFNLDDSGDEAEEEGNPFASLLQQQQQTQKAATSVAPQTEEASSRGDEERSHEHSSLAVETGVSSKEEIGRRAGGRGGTHSISNGGNPRSILKRSQQPNGSTAGVSATSNKKLGFESADSRPARWSTRKPSAADTKNRRKSLSAIQKRRSQLEASAAKRRKSMPPNLPGSQTVQSRSPMGDSMDGSPASSSRRRLLSDVLQRATLLSQQQNTTSDNAPIYQQQAVDNSTDGDAILDTEHQMRAEPFAPQIFSPAKPASTSTATSRKPKADAVVSKIRGSVGDVIRKAIRKSNRDLTLLRSYGQHLLPQQSSHSSPTTSIGALESIQGRPYIMICLKRPGVVTPHLAAYECLIHQVTAKLEKPTADELMEKHSAVLEAHFHPQTVEYLKLSPGKLLKFFEPLHFFSEHVAAGSTSKPKWFLVSTQLTEVVEDNHHCADRLEQCTEVN